jgi:alpha-L-fucosidase
VFSATPTLTSVTFGAGSALSTYVTNIWTPTLKFGLVAPAELHVTPELASSLPTTVSSSLPTTVASTVASSLPTTVETFSIPSNNLPTSSQENPFLTNNTFSITSNPNLSFLSQPFKSESGSNKKKLRTGSSGGKRSKKRSKKGKKRITKKKRRSSK